MKLIFLDIDGVLNSQRSTLAYNGMPWPDEEDSWYMLDEIAVRLIKRLVKETKS